MFINIFVGAGQCFEKLFCVRRNVLKHSTVPPPFPRSGGGGGVPLGAVLSDRLRPGAVGTQRIDVVVEVVAARFGNRNAVIDPDIGSRGPHQTPSAFSPTHPVDV